MLQFINIKNKNQRICIGSIAIEKKTIHSFNTNNVQVAEILINGKIKRLINKNKK